MTPQERNAEMKELFVLLPFLPDGNLTLTRLLALLEPEDVKERLASIDLYYAGEKDISNHRLNSVLRQNLTVRLNALLSFSVITDVFKVCIADAFNHNFDVGVSEESLEGWIFPRGRKWYADLFQWDQLGGGIFDKQEAEKIEQKAYVSAIDQQSKLKLPYEEERDEEEQYDLYLREEGLTRTEKERQELEVMKQEWRRLDEERLRNERELKELVGRWRDEFVQRYGDEP